MTERKKALIVLAIAIPIFSYGVFSFELGGANSSLVAALVAASIAFGFFGIIGGLIMFFTKTNLGLIESKEPKPIIKKEKEVVKDKEEKPEPIDLGRTTRKLGSKGISLIKRNSGSESIGLMQREKELLQKQIALVKEEEELNTSINETTKSHKAVKAELSQIRKNLKTKGWVHSNKGWVIE